MSYHFARRIVIVSMLALSLIATPIISMAQQSIPPAILQIAQAMGAKNPQQAVQLMTALQTANGDPTKIAAIMGTTGVCPCALRNTLRDLDEASFAAVQQLTGLNTPEAWGQFYQNYDAGYINAVMKNSNITPEQIQGLLAMSPDEQTAAMAALGLKPSQVADFLYTAARSTAGEALGLTLDSVAAYMQGRPEEERLQGFGLDADKLSAVIALDPSDPDYSKKLGELGVSLRGLTNIIDAMQGSDALNQALEANGLDPEAFAQETEALRVRNFETERPGAEVLANQPEQAYTPSEYQQALANGELEAWGQYNVTGGDFIEQSEDALDSGEDGISLEDLEEALGKDLDAALAEFEGSMDELEAELEAAQEEASEEGTSEESGGEEEAPVEEPTPSS